MVLEHIGDVFESAEKKQRPGFEFEGLFEARRDGQSRV